MNFEYVATPTIAYTIADVIKNTGIIPREWTPLIALGVGIIYAVAISQVRGDSWVTGLLMGTTGLIATGAHETAKVITPKSDNHEIETMGSGTENLQ